MKMLSNAPTLDLQLTSMNLSQMTPAEDLDVFPIIFERPFSMILWAIWFPMIL